jgi:nickel-dependent lactate racemase
VKFAVPYNLEREERTARIGDNVKVTLVEPNRLKASSPNDSYRDEILNHRDEIFGRLSGKPSLSLLVDDHTRPTPARFALQELLNIAEVSRVRDIRIVVAFGSHEFPPESYLREKVGDEVYSNHSLILHDAFNRADHEMVGYTERGTPLLINRWVASSAVKMAIGSIFPSSLAGFTGGGKMILPGVAYHESIDHNHAMFESSFIGSLEDNPLRNDIDEAARLAGLDIAIDAVHTPAGDVVSLHIGDPISAHRAGVQICTKVYGKRIPPGEVVIIGCGARDDIDFVHVAKALELADQICVEGGTIVLVGACTLGIAWEELVAARDDELKGSTVAGGEVFAHLFLKRYSSIFLEGTKHVYWVTDARYEQTAAALGFTYRGDLQSAVDDAVANRVPTVTVLPRGSLLLPLPA